jgi:hypothetical protein
MESLHMIKKLWKEIIDNSTLPRATNKSSFYYMLEPRFLDFLLVHKFVYSTAANLYGCKGHWINRWIWWFHDFHFFHREQESDGHKGFPTPCVSFSTMCQACEMLDFPIDFNRKIRGSMVHGPWSMIKTHDSIQDFAFENTFWTYCVIWWSQWRI